METLNLNFDIYAKDDQNILKKEREKEDEPYIKLFKIAE